MIAPKLPKILIAEVSWILLVLDCLLDKTRHLKTASPPGIIRLYVELFYAPDNQENNQQIKIEQIIITEVFAGILTPLWHSTGYLWVTNIILFYGETMTLLSPFSDKLQTKKKNDVIISRNGDMIPPLSTFLRFGAQSVPLCVSVWYQMTELAVIQSWHTACIYVCVYVCVCLCASMRQAECLLNPRVDLSPWAPACVSVATMTGSTQMRCFPNDVAAAVIITPSPRRPHRSPASRLWQSAGWCGGLCSPRMYFIDPRAAESTCSRAASHFDTQFSAAQGR